MATNETKSDDILDRLVLDMKAMALLHPSEAELRERVKGVLTESHDESVSRFVKALQTEKHLGSGRLLAIALGELVMASLLVVAGAVVLVPTVVGVNTFPGLIQYLAERTSGIVAGTPLSQYVSIVEFVLGVVLVLSAFFALRDAATNLKQAGLAVKSGET